MSKNLFETYKVNGRTYTDNLGINAMISIPKKQYIEYEQQKEEIEKLSNIIKELNDKIEDDKMIIKGNWGCIDNLRKDYNLHKNIIKEAREYCNEVIKEHENGEYNVSATQLAIEEHKKNIISLLNILNGDLENYWRSDKE